MVVSKGPVYEITRLFLFQGLKLLFTGLVKAWFPQSRNTGFVMVEPNLLANRSGARLAGVFT